MSERTIVPFTIETRCDSKGIIHAHLVAGGKQLVEISTLHAGVSRRDHKEIFEAWTKMLQDFVCREGIRLAKELGVTVLSTSVARCKPGEQN